MTVPEEFTASEPHYAGEWEYGVCHISTDGWPRYEVHAGRPAAELDFRTCGPNCSIVRRHPDGPWEVVPDE